MTFFSDKVFACDITSCTGASKGLHEICYTCTLGGVESQCGSIVCCGGGGQCDGPSTTTSPPAPVSNWVPPTCTNGVFSGCTTPGNKICLNWGDASTRPYSTEALWAVCQNACYNSYPGNTYSSAFLANPNLLCTTPVAIKGQVIDSVTGGGIPGVVVNKGYGIGTSGCGHLIGEFTTDASGYFSASILYGKDYCLRAPSVAGYTGPNRNWECQLAGFLSPIKDSCGNTGPGNNDQKLDNAFVIKYTNIIGKPTGFTGVCTSGASVGNLSWNPLANATSYTLRFNKDPQTDWMGAGDFMAVVNNSSTSYVTGSTSVVWAGGYDSNHVFHSTNCANQPTPCVTTGVAANTSLVANTHYSIAIDGGGGENNRAGTELTCNTAPTCSTETPIPQVDGNHVCTMTSPGSCLSAGNTALAGQTTCPACECVTGVTGACTSSEGAGTRTCVTKNISGLPTCGTFTGAICNSTCSTETPIPQVDGNHVCTMTSPGSCLSAGNTALAGQTTCPEALQCTQCIGTGGLGDADCNGLTTINDASIWRAEYVFGVGLTDKNDWHADFDCNGKVDVQDLLIWKDSFISHLGN